MPSFNAGQKRCPDFNKASRKINLDHFIDLGTLLSQIHSKPVCSD